MNTVMVFFLTISFLLILLYRTWFYHLESEPSLAVFSTFQVLADNDGGREDAGKHSSKTSLPYQHTTHLTVYK